MIFFRRPNILLIAALGLGISLAYAQNSPVQPFNGVLGKTLETSTPSKVQYNPKAPKDAPNVVLILLDDVGYGSISTFGGLIQTPTFDSLANNGLRYTNFHTTAICSPTRASLLTGRNQHSAHMGLFPENAQDFPGYDAHIPFEKATIAEALRENGYSTFALGKWHLTPVNEITQAGPFNRWPTGRGFDHFYGFLYGETDQYHPSLYENNSKVGVDKDKHLNTLLADKAITYIADQKSGAPDKPFFLYFATGAGHAPHQVDESWIDKYKGKFDKGWDNYREEVIARQKKLGVIPADAQLPPRNAGIHAWDSLSADEKKVYARFMESYAGFLTQTDYEIGRIVSYLKKINQLDNTLIFVIVGDNGASKEGTAEGYLNSYANSLKGEEKIKELLKGYDNIGRENSATNFPLGWAMANNTPFRYLKQDANAEGGTHNPLIIFYPKLIKDKGTIRPQYSHVNSIWPTIVDLTGSKAPTVINGYPQEPVEGISLAYTINDDKAPSRHSVQYYEIAGSRSIYKDGWKAEAFHKQGGAFENDKWELYNLAEDFNERNDLTTKYPEKLKELQDVFDAEAKKYNVYPLKDWTVSAFGLERISAYANQTHIVLYNGFTQTFALAGPVLHNRSFDIAADANITSKNAEGVLYAIGGHFGGLSLFIKEGKFQVANNFGTHVSRLISDKPVPLGNVKLRLEVRYNEVKEASEIAGTETIYINDAKVGERKITKGESTSINGYDEGFDVGKDLSTPVSDTYKSPFIFNDKLNTITIDLK